MGVCGYEKAVKTFTVGFANLSWEKVVKSLQQMTDAINIFYSGYMKTALKEQIIINGDFKLVQAFYLIKKARIPELYTQYKQMKCVALEG